MIENSQGNTAKKLKEKLQFRIKFSEDKLAVGKLLLKNNKANDAVLYGYLSIFYAIRALLIHDDRDSDDFQEIIALFEKYYGDQAVFTLDIPNIMKNSKDFRDKIESDETVVIHIQDAEQCLEYAEKVLQQVKSHLQ